MRNRNFKKISLFLVLVMLISMIGFNANFSGKATESSARTKLKAFSISEKELDGIVSLAKQDGQKAAKEVSRLKGNDFELAVNRVLTAYYKKGQDRQRKAFEACVDAKADKIVKDFAEAANERKSEKELSYEAGTSLLSFGSDVTKDEIKAIVKDQYGSCDYIYENADGSHLVKVKNSMGLTVEKAVKAYGKYIETTAVARNDKVEQVVSATELVNDPFAGDQYYLTNMQVPDAWQYIRARNHSRVRVAVIDGGADMNCVDLKNNSSLSVEILSDGSSIPLSSSSQQYINDHGTWVASVIGGTANNGQQIAGIASNVDNDIAELMNIKIEMFVDKIAVGLDYALQNGAKVVNISLYHDGANDVEKAAVDRFYAAGGTVVCGAGNNGNDAEGYPSDYENTISVIAVDRNNQLRGTSNRGWRKDISAPGTDIYVASAGDATVIAHGTSLASPMVAGIATLMYSINPSISSARVKEIILNTAQDIGDPGRDYYFGYGLANAYNSVVAADNGTVAPTENPTTAPQQPGGDDRPAEVFGQLVECIGDGLISVVWGSNTEKEPLGQKYNVYVDGERKLENVACGRHEISGLSGGSHTVKITAVLNGYETSGVEETIQVTGGSVTEPATDAKIEINGSQINTKLEGYSIIYSVGARTEDVEKVGLIYGIMDYTTDDDLYVGSKKFTVNEYTATERGKTNAAYSSFDNAQSYIMIMKFIKTPAFYNAGIRVKAFVQLKNGQYIYSNVYTMTVYKIADYLYQNKWMPDQASHDYLYNNILHFTNSSYVRKDL